MKKAILLICLIVAVTQAMGQKAHIDSLINIALANRYKVRVIVSPNRDSLLAQLQFKPSSAQRIALINVIINNGQETSTSGLSYYYKILSWAKVNHDQVSEAVILAELGYNLYQNGDNSSGLQMLFDALKLAQATADNQALGIVYQDLGLFYLGNDVQQYKYYTQKALHFSQAAHDDANICMETTSLGSIYYEQHRPDSGKMYLTKGLELATRINNLQQLARTIASIANQQKVDTIFLKYQMATVAIATAAKSSLNMSHAFDALAAYYLKHHNTDSGLYYGHKAYYYAMNTSLAARIRSTKLLSDLYDGGNMDSSLKYTKIYSALHDSATNIQKIQDAQTLAFANQQHQQEIIEQRQDDQGRMWFYLLLIAAGFLLLLAFVFWRNNIRYKSVNIQLQSQKRQTEQTLHDLKETQAQLIQSEKMASLGQLAAGIAHEIRNPLNFVNNFSDVGIDMLEQLKNEVKASNSEEVTLLISGLTQSLEKIRHHGKRADSIVKSMTRSKSAASQLEPTDINQLAEQSFNLAYHDLRAKDKSFNVEPIKKYAPNLPLINIIQQDVGRVLLNLFNNAFYAVRQKQKTEGPGYRPIIEIKTFKRPSGGLAIAVKDNGIGMPQSVVEKIMQPFFTTKPPGEGTGLGLSLSYDIIVKGHNGKIEVTSNEGEGSEFVIFLPLTNNNNLT